MSRVVSFRDGATAIFACDATKPCSILSRRVSLSGRVAVVEIRGRGATDDTADLTFYFYEDRIDSIRCSVVTVRHGDVTRRFLPRELVGNLVDLATTLATEALRV